jgi:hypothetical protein
MDIKIVNAATGEEIIREMNDEELAQYNLSQKMLEIEAKEALEKATNKAALLTKLGITEDEARLLLS